MSKKHIWRMSKRILIILGLISAVLILIYALISASRSRKREDEGNGHGKGRKDDDTSENDQRGNERASDRPSKDSADALRENGETKKESSKAYLETDRKETKSSAKENSSEESGKDKKCSDILPIRGINNSSIMCYFSASIQCLLSIDEVVKYYVMTEFDSSQKISNSLKKFLSSFSQSKEGKAIDPVNFLGELDECISMLSNGAQSDTGEFLGFLIDVLAEELTPKISTSQPNDIISAEYHKIRQENIMFRNFFLTRKDSLICNACRYTYDTTKCFMTFIHLENMGSIAESLRYYEEKMIILENSASLCPKCKSYQKKALSFMILRYPDTLLLGLHKFDEAEMKDTSRIIAEDELVLKKIKYKLIAILEHKGKTKKSGHYIAYCKRRDKWYLFNDARVTQIDDKVMQTEIKDSNGYVFVYSKVK